MAELCSGHRLRSGAAQCVCGGRGASHELEGTLSQVSINYLGLTQVSHFSKKEVSGPSRQG